MYNIIGDFMRKKINYIDKFRKFLNKNMVIIDFISKIVFGVCSLILVIIANNLSKDQLNLNKEKSAPYFFISKSNDIKKYDNLYKLENKGGKVNYLKLERIDVFTIDIGNLTDRMVINYYSNINQEKYNKNNTWYYAPIQKYISVSEFRNKALNDLKERYPDEYINITIPESYYKITYLDYQNIYKEDYYTDYGEYIAFNKNLSENGLTEFDDSRYHSYSGMLAKYKTDDELYKVFIESLYYHFDKYVSYKNKN